MSSHIDDVRQLPVGFLRRALLTAGLLLILSQAWTITPATAQQSAPPRVAVLLAAFPVESPEVQQLREGLKALGYVEGRDVVIEWHSVEGDYARLPATAAEMMKGKPDIVVVEGTVAALQLRQVSPTVPMVMAVVGDPLASGLVNSLSRPGGAITGLSMMTTDIITKRLQLLKEAIPGLKRVGVFWDASIPWHAGALRDLANAAPGLGLRMTPIRVNDADGFGPAYSNARRARVQALFMLDSALLGHHGAELLRLAREARLPVAYGRRELAEQGALLSYSADFGDLFRRAAKYVDRILKGANPGELPVEQPTKFELVVNVKTAAVLGLKIPESVLLRADTVIR